MVGEAVPCPQSRAGTAFLPEVQQGCSVQKGLCEQKVMLAFSARTSPNLSALRGSGAQMCLLDRVEKWVFMSKNLFQMGLIKAAKHRSF